MLIFKANCLYFYYLQPIGKKKIALPFPKKKQNIYSEIHYTTKKAKENIKIRDRFSLD
jgi:hypothetical protein